MDETAQPVKANETTPATTGSVHIEGNVTESIIVVGNNNVINKYYQIIEKNIEEHEPDYWALKHPYPMPPNFTGRVVERATLTHWLKDDAENRLFIMRALGGFGKSALSWHWLTHDVDEKEFPKVLWWSFYEGDASFEHFVEETLKYLKCDVPQGKRAQVDELLKAMQGQKSLLIMDGFERALRAYSSMGAAYQGDDESPLHQGEGQGEGGLDCTDINAEIFLKGICSLPKMQSKVLMTTRLTPRAVKPRGEFMLGCREEELTAMEKADAVAFFQKQKIKGTHTEIEAACEPYGYHPLSLRLLAGCIVKDFDNPGDIAVAQHLKIDGDIIQQKHHVLEVSYNSLPAPEQKLLSTIACFRSAVELKTLEAIADDGVGARYIVPQLHDLVDRGLLHFEDKNKKFDLHPIVRRFAYDCLTAADRTGAHERLINYFEAVQKPEKVEKLEDLAPVIELYHHMVRAGKYDTAAFLFNQRLQTGLYFQLGSYQLIIELLSALFTHGEDRLPSMKLRKSQFWALGELADAYTSNGQPHRAAALWGVAIRLGKYGFMMPLALDLGNLASSTQLPIGALRNAEHNLRRSVELCHKSIIPSTPYSKRYLEGVGRAELGLLLLYIGLFDEAEKEFQKAIGLFRKAKDIQYIGVVWSYRAISFLLMARTNPQSSEPNLRLSIEAASHALELADEWTKAKYSLPRDYVRVYWLLGSAYCANNELALSEENLSKALNLCRQINLVELEASILLDLARLRYTQNDFKDAQEKASEALVITERSGYVLQGADVNLFLAELALLAGNRESGIGFGEWGGKVMARKYAEEAKRLATCDGPPYYYKVAYEEAEMMIAKLVE